jgi:LysM repeat protein
MKKLLLALFLVISVCSTVCAQTEPVITKSDNIEMINGKKFYLHKVEKGQTLYSIAKAYQVDIKILEADTNNIPLKIGQIIKIPASENNIKTENKSSEHSNALYHTVLSK